MRYFIDMDGTLARWDYVSDETLHSPGYFANLQPQTNVIAAVRRLAERGDVYILSAYLKTSDYALADKNVWVDKYLPFVSAEHRIFVPYSEEKYAHVPGGVKPDDVLLDDYTPNLLGWEAHSGKGVKLLNGINHTKKTWQGVTADMNDSPANIESVLALAAAN